MLRKKVIGAKVLYKYNIIFYYYCHIENLQSYNIRKKGML